MRRHKLLAVAAMFALLCACAPVSVGPSDSAPSTKSSEAVISFDFVKQSGYASNQFAVWVEDTDGTLVKTLYATRFTAKGGYKKRPESIPVWAEKSGLASMPKSEIDAITGATPKSGTLTYTWDLTGTDGGAVPPGEYRFCVEGNLRWKNRVLHIGVIEIGAASASADATAEYAYEASDDQPALTDDASENAMLGAVSARFVPSGD